MMLMVASLLAAPDACALDAAAFGGRRLEASGPRPLLVIWIREPDGAPSDELMRRKQHYEDIIFGHPSNPGYPDALRALEPSLVDYYRDLSGGKFTWTRAGFVGPLTAHGTTKDTTDEARRAILAAAAEGHFNFKAFDANHDGTISARELAVLIINNRGVSGGQANHFMKPASGRRASPSTQPLPIPGQGVTFAGADVLAGEGGFATFGHELFHGLGGIDLYGPWNGCYGMSYHLSLMGATGGGMPDDERIFHLDPWHKMLVGWIEPRLHAIGRPGSAQLAAQHIPLAAEPERRRPLLIYDAAKGASEFFMLEYRTPYRLGYDRDVASSGLVIWHIAYDRDRHVMDVTSERKNCHDEFVKVVSMFSRGAPDWKQGGSAAYTSAHGEIPLKWMNGQDSGVRVMVAPHKPADAFIEISWSAPVAHQTARVSP